MMSKLIFSRLIVTSISLAAALLTVASRGAAPTTIHDLTLGGAATINAGIFQTINFQTAGTGVIQPFVRLDQAGNNSYEAGYNTSLGTPLDVVSSGQAWHTDILLSSLAVTTFGGVNYYDFRLDLNQASGGDKSELTLNQVQIFGRSAPAPASGVGMNTTTGRATTASLLGTPIWDMNPAGGTADAVKLDFDLNKGGSGKGDMQLLVPTSAFGGLTYVVFYSQFGKDPIFGGTATTDGFEEWDVVQSFEAIPEPSALAMLGLGAAFCWSRRARKQ
jgi:hypothetical protein